MRKKPASAKYDGMPSSAIASGCIDFVLSPPDIAREIARLRQHPYIARQVSVPPQTESEDGMESIFRLLRRKTSVDFSGYKAPTIRRRVQRRMALHKIEELAEYTALLHRDAREVDALYRDLLISVTSFFRNPESFEALAQLVYPTILAARTADSAPIRVWVPGCATGEEVYSHAISLVEFLGQENSVSASIQVFGTDLSKPAIQRARAGFFKENIETDLSEARLRNSFIGPNMAIRSRSRFAIFASSLHKMSLTIHLFRASIW